MESSFEFSEKVFFIELHPTNNCIFNCPWCTYLPSPSKRISVKRTSLKRKEFLNIDEINNVLSLNPDFLLFCGGGDPSSYTNHGKGGPRNLSELITSIQQKFPLLDIFVGTHGGYSDSFAKQLLPVLRDVIGVGISLDASYEATRTGYNADAFSRALNNIRNIVIERTKVNKETYVSSTFKRETWMNLFNLAKYLYDELSKNGTDPFQLKIKFGCTMIADDSRTFDPYYVSRLASSDRMNWEYVRRLIKNTNSDFYKFLGKTHLGKAPADKIPAYGVKHCGMVKKSVLAAADGYYYPCCVMATKRICRLGKIISTSPTDLLNRREDFYRKGTPSVCADGCRVRDFTQMGKKAWTE